MNALPKRANPAFWVDGSTIRALVLPDGRGWKAPDAGVLELPPVLDNVGSARKPIAVPALGSIFRFEMYASFFVIAVLALILAGVSAGARMIAISTRDNQVAAQEKKNEISVLEFKLDQAKRVPPDVEASSIKQTLPIEHNEMVRVRLPDEK
jgi:hypothetical protein